jgi:glutathione synthase
VEINTIASSFGCLSTRVSRLHSYVTYKALRRPRTPAWALPPNDVIAGMSKAMAMAHKEYLRQRGGEGEDPVSVVMLVQPGERNVIDQKALEAALWDQHQVPLRRLTLREVSERGRLVGGPSQPRLLIDGQEVSVAYFRAGWVG